jgi:hypothetical protein
VSARWAFPLVFAVYLMPNILSALCVVFCPPFPIIQIEG